MKARVEVNPSGFQRMIEKAILFAYQNILIGATKGGMQATPSGLQCMKGKESLSGCQHMKAKVPLSGFRHMTKKAGLFEYQHILVGAMEEEMQATQFAFQQRLVVVE